MTKIYLSISLSCIILLLSACGSGEGSYKSGIQSIVVIDCDNNNSTNGTNDCGDITVPNYYTCVNSNDTLISDDDSTVIDMIENSNGTKKVCTDAGSAHILRGN